MHKQVCGWTVNFGPNFPVSPFLELKTRKPPSPHFGKLQIWDDQSLLWNTPPPPNNNSENFRFGMTKVYSGIPPQQQFGKLQIWDDQSLLRNTPPFRKLQIWDDQCLLRNTPHFGKLQIWDDQSLLRNTPPQFRKTSDLGWPKFIPEYPSQFRKTSDLGWPNFTPEYPPNENCQRVQVRDFQNTESYYMWRLYPTRITTSFF